MGRGTPMQWWARKYQEIVETLFRSVRAAPTSLSPSTCTHPKAIRKQHVERDPVSAVTAQRLQCKLLLFFCVLCKIAEAALRTSKVPARSGTSFFLFAKDDISTGFRSGPGEAKPACIEDNSLFETLRE